MKYLRFLLPTMLIGLLSSGSAYAQLTGEQQTALRAAIINPAVTGSGIYAIVDSRPEYPKAQAELTVANLKAALKRAGINLNDPAAVRAAASYLLSEGSTQDPAVGPDQDRAVALAGVVTQALTELAKETGANVNAVATAAVAGALAGASAKDFGGGDATQIAQQLAQSATQGATNGGASNTNELVLTASTAVASVTVNSDTVESADTGDLGTITVTEVDPGEVASTQTRVVTFTIVTINFGGTLVNVVMNDSDDLVTAQASTTSLGTQITGDATTYAFPLSAIQAALGTDFQGGLNSTRQTNLVSAVDGALANAVVLISNNSLIVSPSS